MEYPLPFGVSATTSTLSPYNFKNRFRSSQLGDHPNMDPSSGAPFPGAAQVTQSQYPDIDHDDFNIHDPYPTAALQGNIADELVEAAGDSSINGQMDMSNPTKFDHNAPGMAPPQTPHQQGFSPAAPRHSIDDIQNTGDDSKRKRSKVSRACDECRRKKVRCDAVAEDGTITTCQQCKKAHLSCEYSRVPMKRGPSKGYIKELSERVQQVESLQLQLSGQPAYRPSLDAGSAIGGDLSYSPEESINRRAFSFSDPRNPFAPPEFSRDRLPSTGAWNDQSPQTGAFRLRDRGSLALAPDQQGPPGIPMLSKPFWESEYSTPPAKRRKVENSNIESPVLSHVSLSSYYESVHNLLPVIPDADSAISIAQKSQPLFQHALVRAVESLPFSRSTVHVNGQHEDTASAQTGSAFSSVEDFETFITEQAFESPQRRSDEDNLVFVWICILLSVRGEFDILSFTAGPSSVAVRLKAAADVVLHLVKKDEETRLRTEDGTAIGSLSTSIHQALGCAALLTRIFSFSTASVDPIPAQQHITESCDWLPKHASYLIRSSNNIAILQALVRDTPEPYPLSHSWYTAQKDIILHNHLVMDGRKSPEDSRIQQQLQYFFALLLARYNRYASSADNILQPALTLAKILEEQMTASAEKHVYNPYDMHCFVLTTMTLLELFYSPVDAQSTSSVHEALGKLRKTLEQKSEHFHFAATDSTSGLQNGEDVHGSSHLKSWVDALLLLVEERTKVIDIPKPSDTQIMVDFGTLLRTGYMNVFLALIDV